MVFTHAELEYLTTQRLGRLATVRPDGGAQNSPVGYAVNQSLGTIDIFGWNMTGSRKYRNLRGNPRVSFLVDGVRSFDPWSVQGLELRCTAETPTDPEAAQAWRDRIDSAEYLRVREFPADDDLIRLHPRRIISWGVEPGTLELRARNV